MPPQTPHQPRRGFTLIETMLGVVVSMLLTLALVQFLLTALTA